MQTEFRVLRSHHRYVFLLVIPSNVLSNGVLVVDLLPEDHDVALGCQVAAEDAVAGNDDGRDFYGLLVLPKEVDINWDEDDPDDQKQQHAGGDQLCVSIQIWQLLSFVRKQETTQGQDRDVEEHCYEEIVAAFVTLQQYGCFKVFHFQARWEQEQPGHTHSQLHPEHKRHHSQRLVQLLCPGPDHRVKTEARQDLEQIGQDAGDAEGKGDAKDRHADRAGGISGYSCEAESKAEAHQQGKELQETEVTPDSLHDGSAAMDGEQNGKYNGYDYAKHIDAIQRDDERIRPLQVLVGFVDTRIPLLRGILLLTAGFALCACKTKRPIVNSSVQRMQVGFFFIVKNTSKVMIFLKILTFIDFFFF